jgi:hypothetical protein
MLFLRFIYKEYQVEKTDTLRQYWRQLKMLFDRINGFKFGTRDDQKGHAKDITWVHYSRWDGEEDRKC